MSFVDWLDIFCENIDQKVGTPCISKDWVLSPSVNKHDNQPKRLRLLARVANLMLTCYTQEHDYNLNNTGLQKHRLHMR